MYLNTFAMHLYLDTFAIRKSPNEESTDSPLESKVM